MKQKCLGIEAQAVVSLLVESQPARLSSARPTIAVFTDVARGKCVSGTLSRHRGEGGEGVTEVMVKVRCFLDDHAEFAHALIG